MIRPDLRLGRLLAVWAPLAATFLLVTGSTPVINASINRLPGRVHEVDLAAFALFLAFIVVLHSPLFVTREIAKRADANMASIGYHFGGKENLYLETLRLAVDKESTWADGMGQALAATKSGASVEEALRTVVRQRLDECFGCDRPAWQMKLIIRALLEPSPAMKSLTHERFAPEIGAVIAAAREWNPDLTEAQAELWANSLFGQEIVYTGCSGVRQCSWRSWCFGCFWFVW